MLQDLRFAIRSLRRNPSFTIVAVVTLGLGIGATTAVFSVVNGVLLRPLGYRDPGNVVQLLGYDLERGLDRGTISYPDFADWRELSNSFRSLAAYDEWAPVVIGSEDPERLEGASVSASFFAVLGIRPTLGRFFLSGEDAPGAAHVVVVSHGLWTRRFGGDSAVIGQPITLRTGTQYTIVGVTPRDYEDPLLSGRSLMSPEVWRVTPAYFSPAETERSRRSFTAIGRLRPGVTLEQAQAEMDAISRRLAAAFPESNRNRAVLLRPLEQQIVGPVQHALMIMLGAVGLVLLIAAANVANLLLSRGMSRGREMAIRVSVGASRRRLLRQLLVESLVLAMIGGAVGVGFAVLSTDSLLLLGGSSLPRARQIGIDWHVLKFAVAVTLVTGIVAGLGPALQLAPLHGSITRGETNDSSRRGLFGLRSMLIAGEVALALTLLVGAGLLLRSLVALQSVDPGVQTEGVLTVGLDALTSRYPDHETTSQLYRQLLSEYKRLPGVHAVGAINILPLSGSFNGMSFTRDDLPEPPMGERPSAEARTVTTEYFDAMGIGLRRGRTFTDGDRVDANPVAVINEAMARAFWPGEDPLGMRLTRSGISREIVGIVGNVQQFGLDLAPRPTLYTPHEQELSEWLRLDMTFALRSRSNPGELMKGVRAATRTIDPTILLSEARSMTEIVEATLVQPRFRTTLLTLFGAVALAMGCVGIDGVVSSTVGRRTRELGIRVSLGATGRQIVQQVLEQGLQPVFAGILVGLLASVALTRVLTSLLYGVSPLDPLTITAGIGILTGVALIACLLPARRATRIDPMQVLKVE